MDHFAQTTTDSSPEAANGSAATGQPTYYHSLFSDLVSWKNPRKSTPGRTGDRFIATPVAFTPACTALRVLTSHLLTGESAIAYASIVTAIIATHYLPLVRWAIKLSWMSLALTIAAEVAGKTIIGNGLASQFRPRSYHTLSKQTVDTITTDVHELINFFAIEAQRIFYVESVGASSAACAAAFVTYYLIKIVPYWGLAVFATTLAFFAPLIYQSNQELIDQQLKNASDAINAQTAHVRIAAQKQADHLAAVGKQYAGDYTGKVQDLLRGRSASGKAHKAPEFPSPPTEEPQTAEPSVPTEEPVAAS
ncbi:Reticulon-like protein 1 [Escovopsis weberi]|uniref:Reticulon-like protein n=1 Tax=Escovopsis weberi TaxID=150374 RepID=A0A0M8MTP0_ESCWE|nr:Reticulon-like protein 1 [Escovopsis weberi]